MSNKIKIRYMEKKEFPLFKELFIKIFGEWAPNQFPQIVLFGELDNELVAFATFTRIHVNTVYLQYLGSLPFVRGIRTWNIFDEGLEFIKDEHLKFVAMRIHAQNKKALLSAIHKNFIPVGFVSGYIELTREI